MKPLIPFFGLVLLISCSPNDVNVSDENYDYDGYGGIKCRVNGRRMEPDPDIGYGGSSKKLNFDSSRYGVPTMSLSFSDSREYRERGFRSIRIQILDIDPNSILEGSFYTLGRKEENKNYAIFQLNSEEYTIKENNGGELEILYHDPENSILGGTFRFDAVDSNGNTVKIRKGEFDMKY